MFTFHNIPQDVLEHFYKALDNKLIMRRAMAVVQQRKVARAARAVGGQKVARGLHGQLLRRPMANIEPSYYYMRRGQEQEANAERAKKGENVWDDPEFIDFELKRHPELRPVLDDRNAPVHMGGLVMPTAANFKEAKKQRTLKQG